MRPVQRRVLSSVILVLLTALWGRSADAQTTERVSVASGGTEGNGASLSSALSADGRFVAFVSAATDLVAADTNGVSDVFVHDRQTGATERVSVASGGAQGNGSSGLIGFAFPPALSADGRFIAFVSLATSLVAGDTNGATDVFVRDRLTGTTERVSVASGGTQSNAASLGSALSADGRLVAFQSDATNLVVGDTNGATDVFVRDRQTGMTARVSVASDGTQANNVSSYPALSADGRFVAFQSDATNLVVGDTNGKTDVFVHDRQTGTTERVSVASGGGTQGTGNSGGFFAFPALSADGRLVAFQSDATNLVAGDTNGATDLFVHDRQTGTTERVSVASGGRQGNGFSAGPVLSADGRFVAFHSTATNLVAGDTNGATDVFVRDRQTGTTERASVASGGTQGNGSSAGPVLSADGGLVAFHSTATNLVAGDANGAYDVFVHDRAVSTTTSSTTQPATTSTSSTTTSVSVTSTTSTSTTTSSSTTRPPTTTSTTTQQPTTTTRPTTTTSTTTTSTTTTTSPTTTTSTTTSTTTQPTTTTTRPTTTTLSCEPAQLADDSLAGVECAIGAVRATLNSPPQPACECKHCSLEPVLERLAGFVMQADGATRPKKCKRNLGKAGRAAKALRARVASTTRRNCLAPAERVARLDSEVVDLARRTRALHKSRFCASK
ncbi:MAG: hypothetical protein E6J57_02110 [Deltaproteobacteria bacterium]|nr:MAG: hypothetical protein E6J57_02110 [Deltaproteobacteria bacterium]